MINPADIGKGVTGISFQFTNTKRDEAANLRSYGTNYVIDVNGDTHMVRAAKGGTATVTVVGGDPYFYFEKARRQPPNFYISHNQKKAIYAALRSLAQTTQYGNVSSNNSSLHNLVNATYSNYCG